MPILGPEGFNPPPLTKFEGCSDPYKHVTSINTQMTIIRVPDFLKCKFLAGTLREADILWYMGLPQTSISSYHEFVRKLVHQFVANCHRKMSTTDPLNIWQGPSELLMDYLARFNEATIKVVPLNQEISVEAFQNGLKARHFNESIAQRYTLSSAEVVAGMECCIKGEENNTENKSHNVKDRVTDAESSHPSKKNRYNSSVKEKSLFKRAGKATENFTPLNIHRKHIWREVLHLHKISTPPTPISEIMEFEPERWCKFHRVKGHHTDDCYQLNKEIKKLIHDGCLKKYIKGDPLTR